MSGFKDMISADLRSVFINFEEFGEEYTVEGRKIVIVIDNDELKARQGGEDLAVAESSTLFYAVSEDLPRRRAAGESININGRECLINDWKEDFGISTVVLRENIVA